MSEKTVFIMKLGLTVCYASMKPNIKESFLSVINTKNTAVLYHIICIIIFIYITIKPLV